MQAFLSVPTFIVIAVLAVFSFFFSASETSLIALNKIRTRHLADKGVKGADSALRLITKLDKVVAAILIGNNLVNIIISSIATIIFVSLLGPTWGVVASTLCLTVFLLVMCEIIPKTLAIRYSENTALFTSPILEVFIRLCEPLVQVFTGVSNSILKLFGAHPEKRSPLISEEELRLMIEVGKEEGVLSDEERRMLQRIFEFGDMKVGEVMIPKDKVIAIERSADAEKLLNVLAEEGHSRVPVYEEGIENIVGVIYVRDLLYIMRDKALVVLEDLLHPAYYVPENKRVSDLLREFQLKRIQIAVVVDEQKKTLGLVTLEDLLEEIVGEIEDRRNG